ncbi:MAG: hypothetical protein WKF47_18355 [Geodermatophilaceae bacterium]
MPLPPFDGNTYRKRVLSAVDARGGPEQSDPFELYDLPLDRAESLTDADVAERIDAVWAFWQKQRDHPKYRGVVTAMLAIHRDIADQLRDGAGRRWLAERSREARAERDEARFAELDAAFARLVQRFGGVPADKVDGLRRFASAAGVDEASFDSRLRRHRQLPTAAAAPTADDAVFRQVRDDLDELGQLDGTPPPASLHVLLGLPPTATTDEVRRRRAELAARNRERRPDRRRALVDDLLAAAGALLVDADPGRYLDSLRANVLAGLRPRVAAAVLVEDVLTAQDHEHLLREARAGGLDLDRARSVLAQLAAELGVAVQTAPGRSTSPVRQATEPPRGGWQRSLSQARAALRAGTPRAAIEHIGAAQAAAGMMLPPIRAVRDEVDEILAEADQRWRVAVAAVGGRRYAEAVIALQRLMTIARDVAGPRGESGQQLLASASAAVAQADSACAAALGQAGAARELALLQVLVGVVDHERAQRELTAIGVAPARSVRAAQGSGCAVVSWQASSSPGPVDYRVLRLLADGGTRPVGVTRGTSLEDGAPGAAVGYAVVARRAGIAAPEARTDRPDALLVVDATATPDGPLAPVPALAVVPFGRRIRLVYPATGTGVAEVRRLPAGAPLPSPGTWVDDPDGVGVPVPSMGPGLAVAARPGPGVTEFVVLTSGPGGAVVGARAAYVDLPPVTDLTLDGGLLRWAWPVGCTEVLVLTRPDAPPEGASDPAASTRKVTNTRYEIDGGVPIEFPAHAAVFTCTRVAGRLHVATEAPPQARRRID